MHHLIDFFFDFETRSRLELKQVGSARYASDPSTEATLLTWTFGRGEVKKWRRGQPIPEEILDVALHPEKYRFIAFNIGFDYLIWTVVFRRLIPGLKRPDLSNIEDAMALTALYRLGNSLDAAAQLSKLPYSKDKEGKRIMLKQCKPNSKGEFVELTPSEWAQFERYGVIDTRLLRDIYYMLPRMPEMERYAWEWTFRRNLRGIKIDEDLVNELNSIIQAEMPKLEQEFNHHVNHKFTLRSPKAKDWFKQYYPWIENMQADTVRDMLASDIQVPPFARRALEIKDLAGSSSIAKVETAMDQKFMGRIYGLLAYNYTQTKRWAGRGIQIHNFPRPDDKKADKIDFDLNVKDLASIVRQKRPYLKDPIGFVKNLLRRIWVPDEGLMFYCGDFSKVEPSVLFWLLDLGEIPDKWYEDMAAKIYSKRVEEIGKDSEERQVGKAAALGGNYGMGHVKFKADTYKKTGIMLTDEMSKHVVQTYRRENPKVVKLWGDLEFAFRRAIFGEMNTLCNGKIHVMPMQSPWKGVQIRLPSGSFLYYHDAGISNEEYEEEYAVVEHGQVIKLKRKKYREALHYMTDEGGGFVGRTYIYGGLLTEHVVSAIARDISVPAMWRLENAGFDVLTQVHDEIWGQSYEGREQEFKKLMCINPSWCNMKIGADLKYGVRYLK